MSWQRGQRTEQTSCTVYDLFVAGFTPPPHTWLLCRMDESHLTGESGSVSKDPHKAPLALSGSRVLEGDGRLLVTAVGLESQQGMILNSLTEGQRDSSNGLK